MGIPGDKRAQTLVKVEGRLQRFHELCERVGRTPNRCAYLIGFSDDRAFESDASFAELVAAYAQVGVSDFMFGLSRQSGSVEAADRNALERVAASLHSLRSTASAVGA